jgi:hypothetical protein
MYAELNDFKNADSYFDKFIKDPLLLNLYNNPEKQGLLANYYYKKKNFKKSIAYLSRKHFLYDSIYQNGLDIINQVYAKEINT